MIGADCAKVPDVIVAEGELVRLAEVYPARVPRIRTVSVLPRCVAVGVKVNAVAPLIAAPLAYHW